MYNEIYMEAIENVNKKLDRYSELGSGWRLEKINTINVNIARYRPIRGSSFIPTPAGLREKKAILNVQNNDNLCFLYSILAQLYPAENHVQRVSKYKQYLNTLKYDGIEMPIPVGDIDKFEKLKMFMLMKRV